LLFACYSLVWVHGSRRRPTLKNRGDIGLGEQDSSANPSVLDAVMAHDPPKRFGADLKHRGGGLCGVNFHLKKSTAFGCSLGKPLVKPVASSPRPLFPNAEKLVIVACVASQLLGVVST
jgi:hypothetical protein